MQIRNDVNHSCSMLSRRQALRLAIAASGVAALGQSGWTLAILSSSSSPSGRVGLPHLVEPKREPSLPRSVLYYGSEEPLPEVIPLRAGPLSMIFETKNAFLRYIRLGDREVLRGVYVAVRDRNWGTVTPRIFNLKTEINGASFQLHFDAECQEGDINFLWRGSITGSERGSVEF